MLNMPRKVHEMNVYQLGFYGLFALGVSPERCDYIPYCVYVVYILLHTSSALGKVY